MIRHVLLTGQPGVGKTTVIKQLSHSLETYQPDGFFTQEIRDANGIRKGFELITLDGCHQLLSHVTLPGPCRVVTVNLKNRSTLPGSLLPEISTILSSHKEGSDAVFS